jgi:hypothetical protein
MPKEDAPLHGRVTMYVRDARTGELLLRLRHHNTIVYTGLNAILQLLAQNVLSGAPATHQISTLRVGTGTVAPTRADLGLGTEVFSMALADVNRVESFATGELIITQTLLGPDANGNTLTEAGLFLADGSMFSRQIHAAITKGPAITVTYEWRLAFTA